MRRSSGDGRGGIQASESVIDADTVRLPMQYLHKPGGAWTWWRSVVQAVDAFDTCLFVCLLLMKKRSVGRGVVGGLFVPCYAGCRLYKIWLKEGGIEMDMKEV